MNFLIIALMSLFSSADECVSGSYNVVGNALKRCESDVMGERSYRGAPLNVEVIRYIEQNPAPEVSERFKKIFLVDSQGLKKFLDDANKDKNFNTEMTAEDPSTLDDLRKLSSDLNQHLGLAQAVADLETAQYKAKQEKYKATEQSLEDLKGVAATNSSGLAQLQKKCTSNFKSQEKLQPIRVKFDDGYEQNIVVTEAQAIKGGMEVVVAPDSKDGTYSKRQITKSANGQLIWKNMENGETYPLAADQPLQAISDQWIGTTSTAGPARSNGCKLALDIPPLPESLLEEQHGNRQDGISL